VIESAYFRFVASAPITEDPLVLIRVIESLDCGMTLRALESLVTLVPTDPLYERVAILRQILEELRRPSEVTQVMCVDAALRIVRIFFIRTPCRFIFEHVERVLLHLSKHSPKVYLQKGKITQAVWHIVIFDTFILEVQVDLFYVFQITESEIHQIIGSLVSIVCDNQGPIESVVTEQFQFLCIIITRECLLVAFHVKDMQK